MWRRPVAVLARTVQCVRRRTVSATDVQVKHPLVDTHGRFHDYLRISLTERCNLRCMALSPPFSILNQSFRSILHARGRRITVSSQQTAHQRGSGETGTALCLTRWVCGVRILVTPQLMCMYRSYQNSVNWW